MRLLPTVLIVVLIAAVIGGYVYLMKDDQVAPTPTPSSSSVPSPTATGQPNFIIDSPVRNATVTNPIRVTGRGMAFESTFAYRLKNASGTVLYENNHMLKGFEYPTYGTFDFKIAVPQNSTQNLTIEVFEYSARDGEIIHLVSTPVRLANLETTKVKAYFLSDKLDPQQTCVRAFPVERTVPKTQEVAFVALSEMLRGPTNADKNAGYTTAIPERVAINSITISNGVARVDFNYALDGGVAGSCRVSAIRAQITETLKQFSNVQQVIISREGHTDDVLQP